MIFKRPYNEPVTFDVAAAEIQRCACKHFDPDIVVSVDAVMQKKLDGLGIMESQFYEGGANGSPELVPTDPEKQKQRHQEVRDSFTKRQQSLTERFRNKLVDWYPAEKAGAIKYVEAFEICEYGRRPDKKELTRLFPFFD